jgi:hypothetical protein
MTCAAPWGSISIAPRRAATAHDSGGEELGAWELATIAFLLLAFSAVSSRLERSVVTSAIFFTSAGLLAGPVLGLIDLCIRGERPQRRSQTVNPVFLPSACLRSLSRRPFTRPVLRLLA